MTLRPLIGRDPLNTILVTFGISLVLQNYALWQFGPVSRRIPEPMTSHFTLFYLEYPWYRLVIAALSAAIIGGFWLFLKYSKFGVWIRATTQDRVMAQAMGIPVPLVYTGVFAIGAAMAAASGVLFAPMGGVDHSMGLDWVLKAFIVVVVGGMGNLGGSVVAAIFISLLESYAAIWVDPSQAVIVSFVVLILTLLFRPTGLFVDAEMTTTAPLDKPMPLTRTGLSHTAIFWLGFAVVMAVLIVAPLVLPEFWRRFLTEVLIWGLLAMSSDLLIGYTGMVSFGHSAFFGLGMYGAAGALIAFSPPNLWLAIVFGLAGAAGAALFVAYFSTRLRDIYFAITTLIFSQIFYVIIFTWTTVTGGENGLIFTRPHLTIPFIYDARFHLDDSALVRAGGGDRRPICSCAASRNRRSAWCCNRSAKTRRAPAPSATRSQRYKIVAVMLSGLFAGLAGVLYAVQNEFAAPNFVYFLTSGDTVIFNVMGGIGTLVGPIVGAGFFQLARELMSRIFGDQFPYLIPLGIRLHRDDHLPAAGPARLRAAVAQPLAGIITK